ncbi:MAG: IS3 family transposase [Nitrospirae bacterium]|nr:IS3 family transposase [Fimbriimonadaceae bacterium]
MIRARKTPLPVADCCRLLGVSRASFYRPAAVRTRPDDEETVRLAGEHPRYGYRRLAVLAGIGKKAMRNRTKRLGLTVPRRKPRKRTTFPVPVDAPNLCRPARAPGELLVSDFTYIPLDRGFAYFAVTLDVFSRRLRGWSVSRSMKSGLAEAALEMALASGPLRPNWIHHSDRGVQYACGSFRALVLKAGGLSSFSSPASPGQNAFAESFFSRFKDEVVNLREPAGYAETEREIRAFVEDYNLTRKHSSLGDVSPTTFEERIAEHALELCVS